MRRGVGLVALAAGLVLGLALGLVYAWLIDPVELYNTTPALLRSDYQHEWIRMAALGYVVDGDEERALRRLEGIDRQEVDTALAAMIEVYAAQGRPAETMRALSSLAQRLGVNTPAMSIYLSTPALPSPSPSPTPSPTLPPAAPSPTPAPQPMPTFPSPSGPPLYQVVSQTLVCDGGQPRLAVWVQAQPAEPAEEGEEPPPPEPLPEGFH